MTPAELQTLDAEYAGRLLTIDRGNTEQTHIEADQLLVELLRLLGLTHTAETFADLPKWYS